MYIIYQTGKLTDAGIVKFGLELNKQLGGQGNFWISDIPHSLSDEAAVAALASKNTQMITHCENVSGWFRVGIKRGISHDSSQLNSQRKTSAFFDEFYIYGETNNRSSDYLNQLAIANDIIQRASLQPISADLEKGATTATDLLQSQLIKINEVFGSMMDSLASARREVESNYDSRVAKLEEQDKKIRDEFAEYKALELVSLGNEKEDLEKRRQELEDKDNTHVRRDLRGKITAQIADRLKEKLLPDTILKLRNFVAYLSMVGFVLCAIFATTNLTAYSKIVTQLTTPQVVVAQKADKSEGVLADNDGNAIVDEQGSPIGTETYKTSQSTVNFVWALLIKGVLSSFAALGFLSYSIAWIRNLYLSDAKSHRDLEKFALDINRASWVIETIMEMSAKQGSQLPNAWIEGVCHNLFSTEGEDSSQGPTADFLSTMLNASAKATIGPNGAELEFGKRGTNKLAEAIKNE